MSGPRPSPGNDLGPRVGPVVGKVHGETTNTTSDICLFRWDTAGNSYTSRSLFPSPTPQKTAGDRLEEDWQKCRTRRESKGL